jgi:ubiquinone/menaquinone biosynthesis C-methylase UbiE
LLGIVSARDDGLYELTPLGTALRGDVPGSLRPMARLLGHPLIQRAWGELLHTTMTGEGGFDRAAGMNFMEYISQDPELADRFNTFMGGVTIRAASAVVAAYDFVGADTLVDVGGGDGSLLRAILRAYPAARGVIVDLEHVRAKAERSVAEQGLAERCAFVAGDFFANLPIGADVYLLKSVIHDWDDARASAILAACRRGMGSTSRLLIVEGLVPASGPAAPDVVMSDLIMLAMAGGRERTEAEHRALLAQAGLQLARVVPTDGPSILEAVPA